MPLYCFKVFAELTEEQQARAVMDDIAGAICDDLDHGTPTHECGRDYAVLVGEVNEGDIDWRQQIAESFSAVFGGRLQ